MFTGIVRDLGTIKKIVVKPDHTTWEIESVLAEEVEDGASVMVHGVCLTVTSHTANIFTVDIVPETLACSVFSEFEEGQRVHLEPSLRLQDAMDGHFVMGHVDTVTELKQIYNRDQYELEFKLPDNFQQYVVKKGSIAVNGVSLTVADLSLDTFTVALIPETLKRTIFGELLAGDKVNIEIDMVARYLERMVNFR